MHVTTHALVCPLCRAQCNFVFNHLKPYETLLPAMDILILTQPESICSASGIHLCQPGQIHGGRLCLILVFTGLDTKTCCLPADDLFISYMTNLGSVCVIVYASFILPLLQPKLTTWPLLT